MEGFLDGDMLEFIKIGTIYVLVLVGFALTDWGYQEGSE